MVCSLLAGSMATGFVGCKDYDDDITEINTTTDSLSQQLKDLNTALQAANAEAAAAKAAAAQATDAAAKAMEAAKQAAAEAKAEALKELVAQTEALQKQINANADLSKQNAQDIAALVGRINGIEQGLANIDLTDINKQLGDLASQIVEANKQIEAIKVQLAALDKYEAQIKSLSADVEDIKSQLTAIAEIKAELKTLSDKAAQNATAIAANSTAIAANTAAINELKGELAEVSAKISTEVANSINTIAGVISQRLTSVTLMPDLYVGGIPTISFESAKYIKKVYRNNAWVPATTGTTQFIITNNQTEAQYRLNPGTVTNEDINIGDLAYVSRVATSRAAETIDDIINVASADIAGDGILTVKLGKSNTASLNRTDGKINTVALRVPIADKHLFTEQGETSANVYSEYTRLEETYFDPQIFYVPGANKDAANVQPYADSLAVYNSASNVNVARDIKFNDKEFNLYSLIEGGKVFSSTSYNVMTMEQVRAYGMDIRFHVATRAYQPTSDNTNQQEWVKLSGDNNSILTPVTNTSAGSEAGNEAIIGKQPIICATLYDNVNNNVIDVRYFKVRFTKLDLQPQVFDWDITVTGNPCNGASVSMGWDEVSARILTKLGENGMSKEDFNKVYGTNYTVDPANANNGTLTVSVNPEMQASIPVFSWNVTKEQLGKLVVGDNTAEYKKTLTFHDPQELYPDVIINFDFTVNTKVNAVTLGKTDELKWGTNNTMKVYVVPMTKPYNGVQAHYATNILEGRYEPYVNGLTSCAQYDIKLATGSVGDLTFESGYGHWQMTDNNQDNLNSVIYSIDNNASGKTLASNGGKISVEWWNNINGLSSNPDNRYKFATVTLEVLPILSLNPESPKAIVDNSAVQTTEVAVTITDAFGNLVAQTATADAPLAADYWSFYGVEAPTFNGAIMVADDSEGKNERSLADLNMTANVDAAGVLTFQNNGAPLQANAYLMVPVQVNHLWGTLTGKVAVPLMKNSNIKAPRH